MNIKIHSLVEGAKEAIGVVVIIDVLRACTTVPILLAQGVTEIVPVKEPEDARKYKDQGYILIGEGEHGHVHQVFDYNNSPSEIVDKEFTSKKLVLRSNNATQAILSASKASDIVLASFVNINAVVTYIKKHHFTDVTLIPLGRLGQKGIEDELCAEVIKDELLGQKYNFKEIKEKVYNCETAILVRETLQRPRDVEIALQLNSYNIVPIVTSEDDRKVIKGQ